MHVQIAARDLDGRDLATVRDLHKERALLPTEEGTTLVRKRSDDVTMPIQGQEQKTEKPGFELSTKPGFLYLRRCDF